MKSLYSIGFEKGKKEVSNEKNKKNFSVPIHRVDVLSQGLLLQHAPPNGLKNKSLYLLGFEKGIFLVSDKKIFEDFQTVSSS